MRLSAFIRENSKEIIAEWENFARSLVPPADGMSPLSLRNHISYIVLTDIVLRLMSSRTA
jgi:hypothetical protein